jgi:dipeptidyl aminopeptidase/acylaminoacyl peptidase
MSVRLIKRQGNEVVLHSDWQSTMTNEKRSNTQFEQVTFSSGGLMLHGFIHKPEGNGFFPAILLNHGSEQFPTSGQIIAEPYVRNGYVVFFPHRRGQQCPQTIIDVVI